MYPNPYQILEVSPASSKIEITKAVGIAMKKRKYPLNLIAEAHKILTNPRKRIIADFISPILPKIMRYKRIEQKEPSSIPQFQLLTKFDNLDQAIIEAEQEEKLEHSGWEELIKISTNTRLMNQGIEECKQGKYLEAIEHLQEFCNNCQHTKETLTAQMWLVKAHHAIHNTNKAFTICQPLVFSENEQVQTWAKKTINYLSQIIKKQFNQQIDLAINLLKKNQPNQAITLLQTLLTDQTIIDHHQKLQTQMWLVKAHHQNQDHPKAYHLCQQLTHNPNTKVKNWAIKTLKLITPNP